MSAATTPKSANPWEMKVGEGSGSDFQYVLCPPGNYPGTIVGLYDVGHQHVTNSKGEQMDVRKLIVVFELAEKRPDKTPFILLERYTWSMLENSNFYKLVTNITGTKLEPSSNFNPLTLIGMPVMVSVTNMQKGEKVYHNVGSVSSYPRNFPPPQKTQLVSMAWSVFEGKPFPSEADSLPYVYGKSIRQLAEESVEWKRVGVNPRPPAEEEEDIPF